MLSCDFRRLVAVGLVFTTVLITMPVSAADFGTARSVIGSVSAVGPVELRGIGISQEGTLFSGDSIHAGQKGYAKVLLGTGSKIEVSELSDISVNRDAQGVKIAMNSGTVGFTASTPLRIDILPFEVIATDGAAGHVAVMGSGAAGVRAVNGKVTVRNLKTSESFVVLKGQERLLMLQGGAHAPSLAQIASNVPVPIPAPVPQAPAGRTSSGLAMDTGAWLAVIGGAAVAGVAIWGIVLAVNNRDDIKDLKSSINNLNTTIASGNAATQLALRNISNASAISTTAAQLQSQQASVGALAAQAQTALAAAGNATAAAQAGGYVTTAASLQSQLNALQSQIQALQAQLANGGGSSSQLSALLSQEEALRLQSNTNTTNLNNLLFQFRTTQGVPNTSVSTVNGPVTASASLPI